MSIVFDYADIAARMNCKPERNQPINEIPALMLGGLSGPLTFLQSIIVELYGPADLPPYTPGNPPEGARA